MLKATEKEKKLFKTLLKDNEDWLMQKILDYAEKYDYTKYTSTLKEAWRISIVGLSNSLIKMFDLYEDVPEMNPDDDYTKDPAAEFGMVEAKNHRMRGVNLAMFLGLMKYYRQSYKDLLRNNYELFEAYDFFKLYIERFFDRTEIAYCSEWAGTDSEQQIGELSSTNRKMTNEKNKYLTTFDSFGSPVILIDKDGYIENLNFVASKIFEGSSVSGSYYYTQDKPKEKFLWLEKELNELIDSDKDELTFQKNFNKKDESFIFDVKMKKLPDVSKKFIGYTILLNDITELKRAQEQLVVSEKMVSLGNLVAGVAHEINTPIGIGVSSITHLEKKTKELKKLYEAEEMSEEEFEEYLNDSIELTNLIYMNLNRAAELVKSFKQVAVDQSVEIKREFKIREYTEEVLLSLKNRLKKTHHKVIINCDEELTINSYAGVFSQLITNFVLNSLTHGFKNIESGEIKFDIYKEEDRLIFKYSDSGKGVDKSNIFKIFDPFFTTDREHGSTGLGLHIVYKLVTEKLKGSIECKSEEGKGVEFYINIPLSI